MGLRTAFEQQIIVCMIGTATVVTVGFAGRRIAGGLAGLAAATIAAVYPNFWLYERELMSETLTLLGAALIILLSYRFRDRPTCRARARARIRVRVPRDHPRRTVVAHRHSLDTDHSLGALGAHEATRGLGGDGDGGRRDRDPPVGGVQHGPVPLARAAGYRVRCHGRDQQLPFDLLRQADRFPGLLVQRCRGASGQDHGPRRGRGATTSTCGSASTTRRVTSRGFRWWSLRARRAVWSVLPSQLRLDTGRNTSLRIIELGFAFYWVLVPLAVAGAVLLRRRRVMELPLLAFFVTVTVGVAVTYGFTRFRAAAEVPIVLLAAVSVDRIARWLAS